MRILFINPVGVIGGAERVLLSMISALKILDPNLELFLLVGTDGPLISQAEEIGAQVKLLKLPNSINQLGDSRLKDQRGSFGKLALLAQVIRAFPAFLQYLQSLQQIIDQIAPTLIHSNGIKSHLLTTFISTPPVIWHIHDFYSTRPLMAKILRWCSQRAERGIAISQSVAQDARQVLNMLPIEVIYNAIDTHYFSPISENASTEETVELHDSASLPIKIGLVATFARWKGQDVFLQAAAQVIQEMPHYPLHFYIIGSPIYATQGSQWSQQELQAIAQNLQISEQVEFLGFHLDMANIYRNLNIVVHASIQPEPFGLVIIEAMACGKPVVVAQAGGASELFTHNHDAIGVPPNDPKSLAMALQQLIKNPQYCKALGHNAHETVLRRFSQHRFGEELLKTYRSTKQA